MKLTDYRPGLEKGGGPPEPPVCGQCGDAVNECECWIEPLTLFGNLHIGAKFRHDGREYLKVAVGVARDLSACISNPNNVLYHPFSDLQEVEETSPDTISRASVGSGTRFNAQEAP